MAPRPFRLRRCRQVQERWRRCQADPPHPRCHHGRRRDHQLPIDLCVIFMNGNVAAVKFTPAAGHQHHCGQDRQAEHGQPGGGPACQPAASRPAEPSGSVAPYLISPSFKRPPRCSSPGSFTDHHPVAEQHRAAPGTPLTRATKCTLPAAACQSGPRGHVVCSRRRTGPPQNQ